MIVFDVSSWPKCARMRNNSGKLFVNKREHATNKCAWSYPIVDHRISCLSDVCWIIKFPCGGPMTVPWPCRQLCIILILSSIVCLLLLYQTSFPRRPLEIPALGETPIIFVLTPTYSRPTQLADMTRLCNTLMHIRSIFWIVIEDADHTSKHVS